MLKARDIRKSYDKLQVLKGVDLDVKEGEVVSIVGVSGAGKSTLLHILGTLDSADNGYVEINGVRFEGHAKVDLEPVGWKRRLAGRFIDFILINLVIVLILVLWLSLSKQNLEELEALNTILLVILLLTPFLYYFLLESIFGTSVGKAIVGTKVVKYKDGSKPDLVAILKRTLGRYIPFDPLSYISNKPVGWHDAVSGTVVVKKDFVYQDKMKSGLSDKEISDFRNKNIGFIFQFHNLLPEFSALENVSIPGYLHGRKKEEVEARAKELLIMLNLGHRLHHKPSELSGGEQQRVAIARALINDPILVLADEPSGNLDSVNAEELHKLFFKLRDELKKTFIIVTHNEHLAEMADRRIHMKDGKILM